MYPPFNHQAGQDLDVKRQIMSDERAVFKGTLPGGAGRASQTFLIHGIPCTSLEGAFREATSRPATRRLVARKSSPPTSSRRWSLLPGRNDSVAKMVTAMYSRYFDRAVKLSLDSIAATNINGHSSTTNTMRCAKGWRRGNAAKASASVNQLDESDLRRATHKRPGEPIHTSVNHRNR